MRESSYRVIDGTLYRRHPSPYAYTVKVHELGHGHVEAVAMPRYGWEEVDVLSPAARADVGLAAGHVWDAALGEWVAAAPTQQELLDKAAANRDRSTRRARTAVRRLAKSKGLGVLLTLTYRENTTDRARMARDFDVFVKRLRRVMPGVQYVCVFERQKRGAWHAHIAVPRVLSHYMHQGSLVRSYDLLRSLWRAVVGLDNGNVDVSRNRRVQRSSAKLAGYLSKYIGKSFGEGDQIKYENSYSASGRALPRPLTFAVLSPQLLDAVQALIVDLLGPEAARAAEFHQALLDGGGYFVSLAGVS